MQGFQEEMVCFVCIHGRGVYLQSDMEYMEPDPRALQSCFRWTDFDLLLLSSWASIALLATSFPLIWLMDSKGLY